MHFPADKEQVERARRRLGFDEFLFIQLGVLQRKLLWQGERGYPLAFQEPIHEDFLGKLPFDLTGAQVRALEEIFHDIRRPTPMARLIWMVSSASTREWARSSRCRAGCSWRRWCKCARCCLPARAASRSN